jgi:hypothetical protein
MGGKNYILSRDVDFDAFFLYLTHYVETKTSGTLPAWSHILAAAISALLTAYAAWHALYEKTLAPHTPVDTLAKNNAREAAEGVIRPFVSQYLRYPPITDEDRLAMGIPNHDITPTPVPPPDKFRLVALPSSGDDLPHSVFTRKRAHQFDFPEADRGKSVYFCLRYENSKGDAGPWGPILQAIIP